MSDDFLEPCKSSYFFFFRLRQHSLFYNKYFIALFMKKEKPGQGFSPWRYWPFGPDKSLLLRLWLQHLYVILTLFSIKKHLRQYRRKDTMYQLYHTHGVSGMAEDFVVFWVHRKSKRVKIWLSVLGFNFSFVVWSWTSA